MRDRTTSTLAELYARIEGMTPENADQILSSASRTIARVHAAARAMSPSAEGTALGSIAGDYDAILTQLRSDPAKLPKARRFLSVYLDGVADAGEKFAKLKTVEHRSGLDASFASFLDAAKETAAKQRAALVADDEFNLDVDLEVLRKRMTLEGV